MKSKTISIIKENRKRYITEIRKRGLIKQASGKQENIEQEAIINKDHTPVNSHTMGITSKLKIKPLKRSIKQTSFFVLKTPGDYAEKLKQRLFSFLVVVFDVEESLYEPAYVTTGESFSDPKKSVSSDSHTGDAFDASNYLPYKIRLFIFKLLLFLELDNLGFRNVKNIDSLASLKLKTRTISGHLLRFIKRKNSWINYPVVLLNKKLANFYPQINRFIRTITTH